MGRARSVVPAGPRTVASGPGAPQIDQPSADAAIRAVVAEARRGGRSVLSEPEAQVLLRAVGIGVPPSVMVRGRADVETAALDDLATDRVVVKVVAPGLMHKTEHGGVLIVPGRPEAVADAVDLMATRFAGQPIDGFLVSAFVEHDTELGGELLASVRWTPDFGPVISLGAGGIHAEPLAGDLRPGHELAILSPWLQPPDGVEAALQRSTAVRLVSAGLRGLPPRVDPARLVDVVARLASLADLAVPEMIVECEINPLVVGGDGRAVALDVLARLGEGHPPPVRDAPPLDKLSHLLEPDSIAVVGVSGRQNIGHIILGNLLRDGIDPARITVIKPGVDRIEGCACVPDLAALPGRVDLLVVAVGADRAPAIIEEAIRRDAAEAMIVIPGGLGETPGSEPLADEIRTALRAARATPGRGPLINGGNCLGIRSRPGGYDTLFIPATKLAPPSGRPAPLALIAQSGGFVLARLSRVEEMNPKYAVSVGNQLDLTASDYLAYLKDDPEIDVFAVYVEGFAPLDGIRFMQLSREIADSGRVVILYQAGRTRAGARAAASHTASIASDAVVTRELARQAGAVMADSLQAFDELTRTFALMADRPPAGSRVAAITNAGYESVTVADALDGLRMATFDDETARGLRELLGGAGIGGVADVHDPLDLTPMADDAVFAEAVRLVLASDAVDVGVVGIVPFTVALATLPAGSGHDENLDAPSSIAGRLADLWQQTSKPWVVVVDAGPRYDPFACRLAAAGIPVFRTVDAAMAAAAAFCGAAARRWRD
jgi:acyl-CoA synthetase (NDP forming)